MAALYRADENRYCPGTQSRPLCWGLATRFLRLARFSALDPELGSGVGPPGPLLTCTKAICSCDTASRIASTAPAQPARAGASACYRLDRQLHLPEVALILVPGIRPVDASPG